jgi:hypothetical protein
MYPLLSARHKSFNEMWCFQAGTLFTPIYFLALINSTTEMKCVIMEKQERKLISYLYSGSPMSGLYNNIMMNFEKAALEGFHFF